MLIIYNYRQVAWYTREKYMIYMSNAEAEYIVAESAIKTALTMHRIMVQTLL